MSSSYEKRTQKIVNSRYVSDKKYNEIKELNTSVDLLADNWLEQLKNVYFSVYSSGNKYDIETRLIQARNNYLKNIEPKSALSEDHLIYILSDLGLLVNDYKKELNIQNSVKKENVKINYLFQIGSFYSRKDIYELLKIPENRQNGDWLNGYHREENTWFIFANVGTPGRTGHDYDNYWEDNILVWRGKTNSKLSHESIKSMLSEDFEVLIFTRQDQRGDFEYHGVGKAKEVFDETPVKIKWGFDKSTSNTNTEIPKQDIYLQTNDIEKPILFEKDEIENSYSIGNQQPKRKEIISERIVRDSRVSKTVKEIYDYTCQVCKRTLITPNGPYAEGAHIVPLGGEDQGSDTLDNILCLCPNHHVLFDLGAFVITEDFRIEWLTNPEEFEILNVHPNHKIEHSNLWYHREKWFN